jgi:hypothetical protein
MAFRVTALLALFAAVAGCTSYRTETFRIELRNDTPNPLTLSLAKSGRDAPYEAKWATPEDVSIETPEHREKWTGGPLQLPVLPPGKTFSMKDLTGSFSTTSHGCIRAYTGTPSISEMLARGRESGRRVEVVLQPGDNWIVITDDVGKLVAKNESAPPTGN